MSTNGLRAFDRTLQQTHIWLNDVTEELGFGDRQQAYHALRAVLHALRDRLSVEETAELSAQLPMLVRGLYYEGWNPPSGEVSRDRSEAAFLAQIEREFPVGPETIDPRALTEAVLRVLGRHVSDGELSHVRRSLPASVQKLWPGPDGSSS